MRNLILASLMVFVIAVGAGFATGFLNAATDRPEGNLQISVVDVKGKITAVRPEKNEFVVSETLKDWTFQLAKTGHVFINDREAKVADLKVGDEATVTFDRGPMPIASVVRSTRK